jgi:hypothetical protein
MVSTGNRQQCPVLEAQTPEWPLWCGEEQAYTTACSLVQEVIRAPGTRSLATADPRRAPHQQVAGRSACSVAQKLARVPGTSNLGLLAGRSACSLAQELAHAPSTTHAPNTNSLATAVSKRRVRLGLLAGMSACSLAQELAQAPSTGSLAAAV